MAKGRGGADEIDARQQTRYFIEAESSEHTGARCDAFGSHESPRIGDEIARVRQQFKMAGPTGHVTAGGSTPSGES